MAQIVPVVVSSLVGGKVLNLGAIFDWRKAAAGAAKPTTAGPPTAEPASSGPATAAPPAASEPIAAELPPLDPAMMAHVVAIQSALAPKEAQLARALAAELTPAEMRTWFAELSALSVPEAVAKIRAILAEGEATKAAS